MVGNYSVEDRKWILKEYWKSGNTATVQVLWRETFNRPAPSHQTIYKICDKFDETGSVHNAPKTGRPRSVCTEENKMLVAQAFVASAKKSTRRASIELGISDRSLRRMLKALHMKSYHPWLLHCLLEDDSDRCLQFCELLLNELQYNPDMLHKIIWSDEACFKLSGRVNRHNCVIWSDTNPNTVMESELNQPGVTVWGGLSCDGVIGPVFFDTTVTSEIYLQMLQGTVVPQVQERDDAQDVFFQQDGVPPHFSLAVRQYLDQSFPNRWIGRHGQIEWPPHSPDITPMNFFFWGFVKEKVFSRKPVTVPMMSQYITEAFQEVDVNKALCRSACLSVANRLQLCVNAEGGHFEHVKK